MERYKTMEKGVQMASNSKDTDKKLKKRDTNLKDNRKGYEDHIRQVEGEMNKVLTKILED